jgi:hypothetical protein
MRSSTASTILVLLALTTSVRAEFHGTAHAGDIQSRIVNGTLTDAYPAVGALLSPADSSRAQLVCSGTLIGCNTFLVAAHCVCPSIGANCQGRGAPDPSRYLVFLQHAGFFRVASVAVHPSYDFPQGDVAVLKLVETVTGVVPAAINMTAVPPLGTTGTIVGFGRSGNRNYDYGVKRVGEVTTASCTDGVSNDTSVCWTFTDPMGPSGTDSNTCNGDSGGPLFVDFGCGPVVAGVTSGGAADTCLAPDHSYDANVYRYRDFIQDAGGVDLANRSCGAMPQAGEPGAPIQSFTGIVTPDSPDALHPFTVTAGTTGLRVALNATEQDVADFDLYVKQGRPPTPTDFDCFVDGPSQFAFCDLGAPTPGPWYVMVHRFDGEGTYQVTVTRYSEGLPQGGTDGLACDDGNACTTGDVCGGGNCIATPVADGTACDDGSACTAPDVCQAGTCTGTVAPRQTCKTAPPRRASLFVHDGTSATKDALVWKWTRGPATSLDDLGDPTDADGYDLCVFDDRDGTASLALDAHVDPGAGWTPIPRGYRFRDRATGDSGRESLMLRAGTRGNAAITFKARGPNAPSLALPFRQDDAVTVQLLGKNACWEARYTTHSVNGSGTFRARSD